MASVTPSSASHRIPELDGWRAISVLLVVFSHLVSNRYLDSIQHVSAKLASIAYFSASLGPRVFFVISGFVICRLLVVEEAKYGSISRTAFYYRRALRILPPLLTYLLAISLLKMAGMIYQSRSGVVHAGLFLLDLPWLPRDWFVGHTWSLAVEEQFYLVFPTAWVLIPSRMRSRGVVCVFLLCCILATEGFHEMGMLLQSVAGIAVGVWLALNESRAREVAARVPGVAIAAVCLMLLVVPADSPAQRTLFALYRALVMPPAIGLVLIYSLERGQPLRRILCSKPMQALGLTSYAIYLWQEIFTGDASNYTASGLLLRDLLPAMLVLIPVSYYGLERPAMRLGRFLSKRARGAAPMSARDLPNGIAAPSDG
jgi:peptidoglycan/LPS O-acetylase OafA/YrhL